MNNKSLEHVEVLLHDVFVSACTCLLIFTACLLQYHKAFCLVSIDANFLMLEHRRLYVGLHVQWCL